MVLASPGAPLFAEREFAQAAAADQAWLQGHPGDVDAQLRVAAIALHGNRIAAAEPPILAVISKEPNNTRANRLLAELNRRQEEAQRSTSVSGESTRVPS